MFITGNLDPMERISFSLHISSQSISILSTLDSLLLHINFWFRKSAFYLDILQTKRQVLNTSGKSMAHQVRIKMISILTPATPTPYSQAFTMTSTLQPYPTKISSIPPRSSITGAYLFERAKIYSPGFKKMIGYSVPLSHMILCCIAFIARICFMRWFDNYSIPNMAIAIVKMLEQHFPNLLGDGEVRVETMTPASYETEKPSRPNKCSTVSQRRFSSTYNTELHKVGGKWRMMDVYNLVEEVDFSTTVCGGTDCKNKIRLIRQCRRKKEKVG